MTINELKDKWSQAYAIGHNPVLIEHTNSKTVKFWPTSLDENETHYNIHGWWISNQLGEPIEQELIKIKKDDLVNWHIVEEK
jgi:hypothetical protein